MDHAQRLSSNFALPNESKRPYNITNFNIASFGESTNQSIASTADANNKLACTANTISLPLVCFISLARLITYQLTNTFLRRKIFELLI